MSSKWCRRNENPRYGNEREFSMCIESVCKYYILVRTLSATQSKLVCIKRENEKMLKLGSMNRSRKWCRCYGNP